MPIIIDWNLPVCAIIQTLDEMPGSSIMESPPIRMEVDSTYLSSQKSPAEGPPGRSFQH